MFKQNPVRGPPPQLKYISQLKPMESKGIFGLEVIELDRPSVGSFGAHQAKMKLNDNMKVSLPIPYRGLMIPGGFV